MVIRMKNVSFARNKKPILKHINWEVQDGQHWAIVGLNGSGKTTLLNLVNGYIWPSTGELSVLGCDFGSTDVRELRKSIGWVSSSLQEKLYGNETALDIVLSGLFASFALFDNPAELDKMRALELLEQLKCGHISQQPYKTMSQGEKQKVLIARAMISSPGLLILDEPCTGLDFFSREQLLSTIQAISEWVTPPTLIYVTHYVEEILPVYTHLLLLKDGEVFLSGTIDEILTGNNLSRFFGQTVDLVWDNNRAWMKMVSGK